MDYHPEGGFFTRKSSTKGKRSGELAGGLSQYGYICITVNQRKYLSSRLSFLWMLGYFPENDVDHINRVRHDDRWSNLREVSRTCNIRNSGKRKDNMSGVTGVSWNKKDKRWVSYIYVSRKFNGLGSFVDKDDAVLARWKAEVEYNYPSCNTTSTSYSHLKERNLI